MTRLPHPTCCADGPRLIAPRYPVDVIYAEHADREEAGCGLRVLRYRAAEHPAPYAGATAHLHRHRWRVLRRHVRSAANGLPVRVGGAAVGAGARDRRDGHSMKLTDQVFSALLLAGVLAACSGQRPADPPACSGQQPADPPACSGPHPADPPTGPAVQPDAVLEPRLTERCSVDGYGAIRCSCVMQCEIFRGTEAHATCIRECWSSWNSLR